MSFSLTYSEIEETLLFPPGGRRWFKDKIGDLRQQSVKQV